MGRKLRKDFRDARRASADERREAREARTPQEQLDRLDRILGKGKGAAKERARLLKLIEKGGDKEQGDK
jgi:hypothetical protein